MITQKQVALRVRRLQNDGHDISDEKLNGLIRITNRHGDVNLSMLGAPREAYTFLDGFERGVEAERKRLLDRLIEGMGIPELAKEVGK